MADPAENFAADERGTPDRGRCGAAEGIENRNAPYAWSQGLIGVLVVDAVVGKRLSQLRSVSCHNGFCDEAGAHATKLGKGGDPITVTKVDALLRASYHS
jgi:hypothetical protein